jgi:hypothetical protein
LQTEYHVYGHETGQEHVGERYLRLHSS